MLDNFTVDTVRELQERAISKKFDEEFHAVQMKIALAARQGANYVTLNLNQFVSRFRIIQEMKGLGFSVASPNIENVTFGW